MCCIVQHIQMIHIKNYIEKLSLFFSFKKGGFLMLVLYVTVSALLFFPHPVIY